MTVRAETIIQVFKTFRVMNVNTVFVLRKMLSIDLTKIYSSYYNNSLERWLIKPAGGNKRSINNVVLRQQKAKV